MEQIKLRDKRKSLQITQKEVAGLLNITAATYSKKEMGIREISDREWSLLSLILQTSIDEIKTISKYHHQYQIIKQNR